jgi:hypothetical protein
MAKNHERITRISGIGGESTGGAAPGSAPHHGVDRATLKGWLNLPKQYLESAYKPGDTTMTTCDYHIVLDDTEAHALEDAMQHLIEECNTHRRGNGVASPWDAQKLAALTILDKLHGDVRCNNWYESFED